MTYLFLIITLISNFIRNCNSFHYNLIYVHVNNNNNDDNNKYFINECYFDYECLIIYNTM